MEKVSTIESNRTSFFGCWAFFDRGQSEHMAESVGVVGGIFTPRNIHDFSRFSAVLHPSHFTPYHRNRSLLSRTPEPLHSNHWRNMFKRSWSRNVANRLYLKIPRTLRVWTSVVPNSRVYRQWFLLPTVSNASSIPSHSSLLLDAFVRVFTVTQEHAI